MKFLTDADIQTKVRELVSDSEDVRAAVAYWGQGAAQLTGLAESRRRNRVRVICDLLSGACNPAAVKELAELGIEVRTLDRLHAKVWTGDDTAIVGSANASHSGLPSDAEEAANASIEAAVVSREPSLVQQATKRFEEWWCASSRIEEWHFERAQDLWIRRHHSGGRGYTTSLIEKARSATTHDLFADLRLVAYRRDNPSNEAMEHICNNYALYWNDQDWGAYGHEEPWFEWCRDNPPWPHRSGTVFADFNCAQRGTEFTFNGFWQIRKDPNGRDIELEKVRLTLLNRLPHFKGYTFSPQEKRKISDMVGKYVAMHECKMDKFEFYIDKNFLEFWNREYA